MAAYAVNDFVSVSGTGEDAAAALETQLEDIDAAKTIRLAKIVRTADNKYAVVLITDA